MQFGEVPKLAEGTPLERVQVVNSGARVQIPPSPFAVLLYKKLLCKLVKSVWNKHQIRKHKHRTLTNKQ